MDHVLFDTKRSKAVHHLHNQLMYILYTYLVEVLHDRRQTGQQAFQQTNANATIIIGQSVDPEKTLVRARMHLVRQIDAAPKSLRLDGESLTLQSVAIDSRRLTDGEFSVDEHGLEIHAPPEAFELQTEVVINPAANTALEGLYQADCGLLTQCEAEGFRKITYYLDRPDVMARFDVTIEPNRRAG